MQHRPREKEPHIDTSGCDALATQRIPARISARDSGDRDADRAAAEAVPLRRREVDPSTRSLDTR